MTQPSDDAGLPDDVFAMIRDMCAENTCPDWALTRRLVYGFAQAYARRHETYLDDADDLTSDVMLILATPGKLAAFGQRLPPGADPTIVRRIYLAYLHTITRRVWIARLRYYLARPSLVQLTSEATDIEVVSGSDPADPRADVPIQVESRALLSALFARLQGLANQGDAQAARVARFLLAALDGVPYKVLGDRFHLKPSQVRDEVLALRRRLRELLLQWRDDEPGGAPESGGPSAPANRPKKPRSPGGPQRARPPAEAVPALVASEPMVSTELTTDSKGA